MKISPRLLIALVLTWPAAPLVAQNNLPTTFPTTQIARMDAASYLTPLPENRVLSYKQIAGDFAANETAALGKYNGKRITVIGRIAHLSQGQGEKKVLVVTLQGADASLPAVKCDFLADAIPVNSEIQVSDDGSTASIIHRDRSGNILSQDTYLSVDQKVGIKGSFKELKVGDIILTSCKLIPKERMHELSQDR
jgi:hypothetical protein